MSFSCGQANFTQDRSKILTFTNNEIASKSIKTFIPICDELHFICFSLSTPLHAEGIINAAREEEEEEEEGEDSAWFSSSRHGRNFSPFLLLHSGGEVGGRQLAWYCHTEKKRRRGN